MVSSPRRWQPCTPMLYGPPLFSPGVGRMKMAEMEEDTHVSGGTSEGTEKEERQSSRPRTKKKASNMSFEEMVEMVDILICKDYDGRMGSYPRPNARKEKIMEKVVHVLHKKFGVRRTKEQLRKRWSDLKLREEDQFAKIKKLLKKSEYILMCIYVLFLCAMCSVFSAAAIVHS